MSIREWNWSTGAEGGNVLLSTTTQKAVLKSSSDRVSGLLRKGNSVENLDPQTRGLGMKLVREMSNSAVAEVTELRCEYKLMRRKWSGRGKTGFELFVVRNVDFGIVPLRPKFVCKSERSFLSFFSSSRRCRRK